MNAHNKKIVAIALVLIMVLSGLAVLSSTTQNSISVGTTGNPITPADATDTVSSGSTSSQYYGTTSTWSYTVSGSSSNCKTTSSSSSYPSPSYPSYPSAPSSASWTLTWDSYTLGSGSVSSSDITYSHSTSYRSARNAVGEVYVTCAYSTTSWKFSVSPSYTWTQYGSLSGVSAGWTLELDSQDQTGTIVLYTAEYSTSVTVSGPSSLDLSQTGTFSASIPSSFSPTSYQWYLNGNAVSGATSSSYSTSFGASTSYSIFYTATNSTGFSYESTALNGSTTSSDPTISISAVSNPSDAGQTVDFSTTASGGSGTYSSYSYILYDGTSTSNSQLASGSTSSFSYTFSSSGSYLLDYSVTDSNGYTSSSSLTQSVNTDPSVSISSSQNPTDSGNTVEFSSVVSGGTSPYNYTWSANGNTYYTKDINVTFSSSGTYTIDLTVTDAAGYSVSTSLSQTVNSDPTVSASSNVSSADIGYPIEFLSSPSGGTGPYTYSWVLNGNAVSHSEDFSYSFSSSGSYTLTVTITDSVRKSTSASVTVSINNNPSVSTTASQNPTDVGNSVDFTSTISGGTGTMTYSWLVNGVQESTSSSFTYSFDSTGSYTINLTVTDSDGHVAYSQFTEVVNADPAVTISASHNPTDAGIPVNFTSTISGGTGPYKYSWAIDGSNFNASYVDYTFTASGTYSISLTITDSNGNTATDSISEVINPDPAVSISVEYNPVDQGRNDTMEAVISGGTSPFNYTWTLGSQVLNYSQEFHYSFASTGTYTINLTITDSQGLTYSTSVIIKVIEKPSALIEGVNKTDISTETYWEGYGSYGTAPYQYYWYVNGVNTSAGLYLEYSFPDTGNYNISLLIIDSQGSKAYAYLNVTVEPKPVISISSSTDSTDVGNSISFTSSVSGGSPFFNYTWRISSLGFVGYQQDLTYEFSNSGTYNVTVQITDGSGNTASASITITIHSLPNVSIKAEYSNVDVNVTDSFNSNVSGGTAPYSYAWYIGSTYEGNGTSISYAFTSAGIYSIELKITDAAGTIKSYRTDISVHAYPVASIIISRTSIDASVDDNFRASGTGGVGPYSYEWLIAGNTFNSSSISYAFASSGNYTIQLIIVDSFGKDASVNSYVIVYPDPVVHVSWNGKPTVSQEFNLYANISGGIGPYSISWIFPSGQHESGLNITHVFSSSGPETFEVQVSDKGGYSGTTNYTIQVGLYVSITSSTRSGLAPLAVQFSSSVLGGSDYSYNWTFSPGHYSLAQNPEYTFGVGNYTVHFVVRSANGAVGYANISIQSLPAPVTLSYSSGLNITQTFHFNGTPSWYVKAPYNLSWSFPNGQTLTGMHITYNFPVYTELNTVIVTFTYGNNTYTKDITIRMVPATPSVSFTPPSIIPVDTMLSLNATASAPDSNSFTYSWLIDGSSYSGQNQLYYFDNTGNISISVTATDSLGASSTVNKTIDVVPEGKSSSIAISYTKQSAGAMEFYNIKVVSSNGIVAVEAFLSTTQLNISEISSSYTSSGEVAHFNLTMNQRDYSAGTYSISVVGFNNDSQSNHISLPFTVTSNYASASGFSLGDAISFFGGISNFIIVLLTLGGLIIAYAGLHASRDPDVVIQEGTGKKKRDIVLQGRRKG